MIKNFYDSKLFDKGDKTAGEDVDLELFWGLPDIGPRIDMKLLPRLYLPEEPVINSGFKGHLLSPKEGCGISKVGAPRIVGGTSAKPGKNLSKIAQIMFFNNLRKI